MHNPKVNFLKFFDITKTTFSGQIDVLFNFQSYRNKPKMSDCEILALVLTAESMGIDSENYLFGKLRSDYRHDFPLLMDRSNFNRRRKRLGHYLQQLNERLAGKLNADQDVFIVDSIPVPVCQLARERRSKICREDFDSAPDKGYSAVQKNYFYGYKLHLVTSAKGVFQSMDMTKASVHDVHYLKNVKCSGIRNCTLIGDKGYLSGTHQLDLFTTCEIRLETPMRANQQHHQKQAYVFRKSRKRIETFFSQLCDQFMLKRNYAKTARGVFVRVLSKITAATTLQFFNFSNNKPLNHLKFALHN